MFNSHKREAFLIKQLQTMALVWTQRYFLETQDMKVGVSSWEFFVRRTCFLLRSQACRAVIGLWYMDEWPWNQSRNTQVSCLRWKENFLAPASCSESGNESTYPGHVLSLSAERKMSLLRFIYQVICLLSNSSTLRHIELKPSFEMGSYKGWRPINWYFLCFINILTAALFQSGQWPHEDQ